MGILAKLESRAVSVGGVSPRDPVLENWFGAGSNSAAGFSVTPDSAMRATAVFSCVRVLAESIAALPLIMYRRLPDGGKERATDNKKYNLIGRSPNPWQTRFEFIEMGMVNMLLRGASYSRILSDKKGNLSLIPLHPDNVSAKLLANGSLAYQYRKNGGGSETLLQDEVLRIPFMIANNGVDPVSVISAQREIIGAHLAANDYSARFFANDAKPTGGYLSWESTNTRFSNDEEEQKFRSNWQQYIGGDNRHKIAILKPGLKYTQLSMTNEDAQFLETKKSQISEIAGMFRVPPHMIGQLDRATFSNIEQQSIDFVVHTIGPWLARWEQALNRALLNDQEQEEYFFEFLTAGLLRGDSQARANYLKVATGPGGWMSRNEGRAIENLNKAEGLDNFLEPLNAAQAGQLGTDTNQSINGGA